ALAQALHSFPTRRASDLSGEERPIEFFTTRPDTLFGATYMVLSPEHDLVDELVPDSWPSGCPDTWTGGHATPPDAVRAYRAEARSEEHTSEPSHVAISYA